MLLRHDQWIVCAGLVAITGLAWIYLLSGAGMAMNPFDMTTLSLVTHQNAGMAMNMPEMNMVVGGMVIQSMDHCFHDVVDHDDSNDGAKCFTDGFALCPCA